MKMAYIPEAVRATALIMMLVAAGLKHLNSGKSGELFELSSGYLLMVRTDRVSIFDFVLNGLVSFKGSVLTAMTVLWLTQILAPILEEYGGHHLVAYGSGIDAYLPQALKNDPDLQCRSIVIRRLPQPEIECIVRGYLTGSGLKAYLRDDRWVCGHQLPDGLHDGSRLPQPIFTPTSKADIGHDEDLDFLSVRAKYSIGPEEISLAIYNTAYEYAKQRGFLLADTKVELSQQNGWWVLVDEVLTQDSSRWWRKKDWEAAQSKVPPSAPNGFDKEFVRRFGKTVNTPFSRVDGRPIVGISNLDPENTEHVKFVSSVEVPRDVLQGTSDLYLNGFELLFGQSLGKFWEETGVKTAA